MTDHPFVAHSTIRVPAAGEHALTAAFRERLGEVEQWPGFGGLQVWRDRMDPTRFEVVSW